jgi:hypothetical protein
MPIHTLEKAVEQKVGQCLRIIETYCLQGENLPPEQIAQKWARVFSIVVCASYPEHFDPGEQASVLQSLRSDIEKGNLIGRAEKTLRIFCNPLTTFQDSKMKRSLESYQSENSEEDFCRTISNIAKEIVRSYIEGNQILKMYAEQLSRRPQSSLFWQSKEDPLTTMKFQPEGTRRAVPVQSL